MQFKYCKFWYFYWLMTIPFITTCEVLLLNYSVSCADRVGLLQSNVSQCHWIHSNNFLRNVKKFNQNKKKSLQASMQIVYGIIFECWVWDIWALLVYNNREAFNTNEQVNNESSSKIGLVLQVLWQNFIWHAMSTCQFVVEINFLPIQVLRASAELNLYLTTTLYFLLCWWWHRQIVA